VVLRHPLLVTLCLSEKDGLEEMVSIDLSCSLEKVYDLFVCSDSDSYARYHEERGDFDYEETTWAPDSTFGGAPSRLLHFKSYGPMNSCVHVAETQVMPVKNEALMIIDMKQTFENAPMTDCFVVLSRYIFMRY
jgi:hypothetical protein